FLTKTSPGLLRSPAGSLAAVDSDTTCRPSGVAWGSRDGPSGCGPLAGRDARVVVCAEAGSASRKSSVQIGYFIVLRRAWMPLGVANRRRSGFRGPDSAPQRTGITGDVGERE